MSPSIRAPFADALNPPPAAPPQALQAGAPSSPPALNWNELPSSRERAVIVRVRSAGSGRAKESTAASPFSASNRAPAAPTGWPAIRRREPPPLSMRLAIISTARKATLRPNRASQPSMSGFSVSLSDTFTGISFVTPSYPPPAAACVTVSVSSVRSSSSATETATVCARSQFVSVNVRRSSPNVRSVPGGQLSATVTGPLGRVASRSV